MSYELGDSTSERSLMQGLLHFTKIFGRYRWLILAVNITVTALATAFVIVSIRLPPDQSFLPNQYTAQATILVNSSNQAGIARSILDAMGIDQRSQSQSAYDNGDLILEILQSRLLLDRLVDEFGLVDRYKVRESLRGNSRKILLKKANFTYARNTGAFKVFYTDYDPQFARNLVNRMVELLGEWFSLNRGLETQKQRQLLADKIAEVKNEISNLQSRLKNLQKQYGVLNVEELGQSQAASLASLRSQLILKEVEIKNYSGFSKIKDPRLEQLKEERQNLLDLIAQSQIELPGVKEKAEGKALGAGGSKMSLPDVAQEFSQLMLELDIQQRIYNTLSPQYETVKLAPETDNVFQVLELADAPDIKSGPIRSRIVIMAFVGSLALGLVLALGVNGIQGQRSRSRLGARASLLESAALRRK
jgi:tyrosine-protein kinase Etk/Wzc